MTQHPRIAAAVVFGIAALAVLTLPAPALARGDWGEDWCDQRNWGDRGEVFCEVREFTLAADREVIRVDSGTNGGIQVEAWDRNEILLEVKVAARADTEAEAAALAGKVEVSTGSRIGVDGPRTGRRESWWASFRLRVPARSNLDLEAHNGGITIEGVHGDLDFETTNGGVHLEAVAGDVRGRTTNGGVHVTLAGTEWDGEGLDVVTTNGGVRMSVPEDYNARIETGTVNGSVELDFPITLQGKISRQLEFDLGNGGRTLRVETTNGGVRIRQI